ncbi:MAG TPA: glycosyltransferase family 2 protein [Ktedonobacterales bacterium]|nr:glycosyltransferase family 2 protein [Ktedonobacterales bacterium]
MSHEELEPSAAPRAPHNKEKYLYLRRHPWLIVPLSCISFVSVMISSARFLNTNRWMWWLMPYLAFTILYFFVSLAVNLYYGGFNLKRHKRLVEHWAPYARAAGIDIFLPTSGEPLTTLMNTWNGVAALRQVHIDGGGSVSVYVLDDAARTGVKTLAHFYGFRYSTRPDRGWFKKAGNLRHGYRITQPLGHQFVAIFDADFRPRTDFFRELLPYFFNDYRMGLVQSPQYFDVHHAQTWLQRGAGAVQEFFYRYSQVARDKHDAAICVGTNAVYRRMALDATGGTALIEHSEDVHTGFNMRMHGWHLRYVPLILAKGVCPDTMEAFFKQQYRWCMGSMSLLGSGKFWRTGMKLRQRLCYFTGFFYYIHTAVSLFVGPVVPLLLLTIIPQEVLASNYLLLIPAFAYVFVIFPLWHKADYGSEAWSVKHIYSWAHLFALVDVIRRRPMGWSPTGATSHKKNNWRYRLFRVEQIVLSFIPNLAWVLLAALRVGLWREYVFLPLLLSGLFVLLTTGRVAFYRQPSAEKQQSYADATGDPTGKLVRVEWGRDESFYDAWPGILPELE